MRSSAAYNMRCITLRFIVVVAAFCVVVTETRQEFVQLIKLEGEQANSSLARVKEDAGSTQNQTCGKFTRLFSPLSACDDFGDGQSHGGKWPAFELNWRLVVSTMIGFLGACLGSVGGIGGGGFFLPMFNLIMRFDAKTSSALSKGMVMGGALVTTSLNWKQRHPCEDRHVIDFDIAVLFQPMLLLGISFGVILNIVFAEWMVTILIIVAFSFICWEVLSKAVAMWKTETILSKVVGSNPDRISTPGDLNTTEYVLIASCSPTVEKDKQESTVRSDSALDKKLLLLFVWMIFLALQIFQVRAQTCGLWFWILNIAQIPLALGVTCFAAVYLTNSKGNRPRSDLEACSRMGSSPDMWTLASYALSGFMAGTVGGLLGVGGGALMAPAFLRLGLVPQAVSATSTFLMVFSSSLSVLEYYLLDRIPPSIAAYFIVVAGLAALCGQLAIQRLVKAYGRTSLIVFVVGLCVAVSTVVLGTVGTVKSIDNWKNGTYMGFESLCSS